MGEKQLLHEQKGAEMFVPSWDPAVYLEAGTPVAQGLLFHVMGAAGQGGCGKQGLGQGVALAVGKGAIRLNALMSFSVMLAGVRAKVCWSWIMEVQSLFSEVSLSP